MREEEEERRLLLHHNPTIAETLSLFTNMSNWAFFFWCVCFGFCFFFFKGGEGRCFGGRFHNLFNSQGCVIIWRGVEVVGVGVGKKILMYREQAERGMVVCHRGNPNAIRLGAKCQIFN